MNKPKISVVMPVYNSEKYLKESIGSILNQTFKDFEFIIINDASTDNSLNVIKSYKDKRIKLITNNKNLGVSKTRNIGLDLSSGKYIAVMDSDDISLLDRLRLQFDYLERQKHIFLLGGSAIFIDEDGKEIRRFRKYDNFRMLAWRLPKSCGIIHSSVMFRNEKNIFYSEIYPSSEDYNLYLDLLVKGKNLTNMPQFLIKYRVCDSFHSNEEKHKEFSNRTKKIHSHLNYRFNLIDKISFSFKLLIHYLKTYMEKRGR